MARYMTQFQQTRPVPYWPSSYPGVPGGSSWPPMAGAPTTPGPGMVPGTPTMSHAAGAGPSQGGVVPPWGPAQISVRCPQGHTLLPCHPTNTGIVSAGQAPVFPYGYGYPGVQVAGRLPLVVALMRTFRSHVRLATELAPMGGTAFRRTVQSDTDEPSDIVSRSCGPMAMTGTKFYRLDRSLCHPSLFGTIPKLVRFPGCGSSPLIILRGCIPWLKAVLLYTPSPHGFRTRPSGTRNRSGVSETKPGLPGWLRYRPGGRRVSYYRHAVCLGHEDFVKAGQFPVEYLRSDYLSRYFSRRVIP
eukprot:IDg1326t1